MSYGRCLCSLFFINLFLWALLKTGAVFMRVLNHSVIVAPQEHRYHTQLHEASPHAMYSQSTAQWVGEYWFLKHLSWAGAPFCAMHLVGTTRGRWRCFCEEVICWIQRHPVKRNKRDGLGLYTLNSPALVTEGWCDERSSPAHSYSFSFLTCFSKTFHKVKS